MTIPQLKEQDMASGPDPAFVPAASSRDASRPYGLQSGVGRELICQRCNCPHRVWSAASPLWNATVRSGCINGDEEYAFLCPNCFMELAEDRGVASLFRVTAERTAHLQLVTPSGRVWNEREFRYELP